jgi:DNA ligase (NAD+)
MSLKALLDQIDAHDTAYYNDGKPTISDPEYDGLKDRLGTLVKAFSKASDPATEALQARAARTLVRIGAPPPEHGDWPKYTHDNPMDSLNKVNLPVELRDWEKRVSGRQNIEYLISEKLDGMSISLVYKNGHLFSAATRGGGDIGENITANVSLMDVPLRLKKKFSGHIRGEIVLLKSVWKKHLSNMANTRNATSLAKRHSGEDCQHLTIIAYTIEGKDFNKESEAYEYIKELGFKIPNYRIGTVEDACVMWLEYMDKTRDTLDYDIDGLVLFINDRATRFALGDEGRGPKGAIAFKFEAPEARTTTTDIVPQVGDTGIITPVAEFEEIELLGVKIRRASLHNFSLVKELGINIGAEILVTRANDVIPYVKEVTKPHNGYFPIPEKCPACGTKTVRVGEYVRCPNKQTCPPQVIGRLNKWIGELGILEWGESILTKLIEAGLVKDIADLYRLTAKDITGLDRMGEKGAARLLGELDKFRAVTLENFVGGLCIDGVATSTVKSVIDQGHDSLDKLRALSQHQLEAVPGFGEKRARALFEGLKENKGRMDDLISAGVTIKAKIKGALTGKKIAITGTLSTPRKQIQAMITDAGGEVDKSVGKNTTYLLIDDVTSTSSKAQGARKLGTKLISEKEFLDLIKRS